nr:immunoglobulin heavy chain junction region [Mus musculus]
LYKRDGSRLVLRCL